MARKKAKDTVNHKRSIIVLSGKLGGSCSEWEVFNLLVYFVNYIIQFIIHLKCLSCLQDYLNDLSLQSVLVTSPVDGAVICHTSKKCFGQGTC
jgi:hypothetical protein